MTVTPVWNLALLGNPWLEYSPELRGKIVFPSINGGLAEAGDLHDLM